MNAESSYLFRHALLRDAAYQLQLPGDRRSEGVVLVYLSSLYVDTGRRKEAEHDLEQALALARGIGNRPGEGDAMGNLAQLYFQSGRVDVAGRAFEWAIAIHREVRHRRFLGYHLCDYSHFLVATGKPGEAREPWKEGAAIMRELGEQGKLGTRAAAMRKACALAHVPPLDEAPV